MPTVLTGTFLDITRSLVRRISELRSGGGGDALAGWLSAPIEVLVPSRGPAEAIARGIVEQTGHGVAGLVLQTPETLARRILNDEGQYPRVAGDAERRLAMTLGVTPQLAPIFGIATMLERSYRDIRDSGMPLTRFARETARLRDNRRGEQLAASWNGYEEILSRMNLIDPADLFIQAVAALRGGFSTPPQIVFGFYDTTGVQEQLLSALEERDLVDSVYVPVPTSAGRPAAGYEFASRFLEQRSRRGAAIEQVPGAGSGTRVAIEAWQTPKEELREVCRAVRWLLDSGIGPGEIGIACRSRDDQEAAHIARYAAEFDLPLDPAAAMPLRSHRIGRSIASLLSISADEFPRSRVIGLLRDGLQLPGTANRDIVQIDFAARKCGIAGGGHETVQRALPGIGAREPSHVTAIERYVAVLQEMESIASPLGQPMDGRAWSAALSSILQRFRIETESDLAAADAVESIASLLARSASAARAIDPAIVAAEIQAASIPVGTPRESLVWFGDVMSLRGRSFEHLFLVRMQHDRFPQGRSEDPLLSDAERRTLAIPEIGDGREEERLLFLLARDAARSVLHCSFAASDGFGRLLRPSHLLQQLALDSEEDPKRRVAVFRNFADYLGAPAAAAARSASELRDEAARSAPRIDTITPALARSLVLVARAGDSSPFDGFLTVDDGIAPLLRERLAAISATNLEDYGECPQKFLFRRLLKVDELLDPEHEPQINPLEKGSLDHTILERFYTSLDIDRLAEAVSASRLQLSRNEAERLRSIVEREFDEFDRERPPFNESIRRMERRITAKNLERFLVYDLLDLLESGFRPRHFEYAFGTDRRGTPQYPDRVRIEAGDGATLAIHGIIDRIDGDDEGRVRVIDYKSGKANQHSGLSGRIEDGHRMQLALYAIAVQRIFELDDDRVSGAIKPLRVFASSAARFSFELAECKPALVENLDLFTRSILAGRFPAVPNEEGACRFCPVKAACRTRHDADEIRQRSAFGNAKQLLLALASD